MRKSEFPVCDLVIKARACPFTMATYDTALKKSPVVIDIILLLQQDARQLYHVFNEACRGGVVGRAGSCVPG